MNDNVVKPNFFKMVQNGIDIYAFIVASKNQLKTKRFSISVDKLNIDMNVKNPLVYYNEFNETYLPYVSLMRRFECGDDEDLKKNIIETVFDERIIINGLEKDVYRLILND